MADVINMVTFGGEIPTSGDRSLPDGYAVESCNTYLYSGELRGVRPPLNLADINSITKKVFRIPKGTVGGDPANPSLIPPPSYLGDSLYMQFTDPDTDIVRAPVINDSFKRWYFCSPSTGPMYNTTARMAIGDPPYLLGVNAPATAPTLTVSGGSFPTNVSRVYLVTWQTIYGEESAPSLTVTAAGKPDGTWHLTAIPQPSSGDTLNRAPISKINVYRTITGASGVATYFRVVQLDNGTTSYDDALDDTIVANGLDLESINFNMPPLTLKGIMAMPNGYLVGWDDANLYFSEPYRPHAWPVEYIETVEYPIVGLGVFGTTGVACTEGYPVTFTGVAPISVAFTKTQINEPCLSRGSIVSNIEGVYYASQNGLMAVTPAGLVNVTADLIVRGKWIVDFAPQYIRAVRYHSGYLALKAMPSGVNEGFFLDPSSLKVAVTKFIEMTATVNLHADVWSGEIFMIDNSKVKQWDPSTNDLWPVKWRSKEYQLPRILNFGCYEITWDEDRYANNSIDTAMVAATTRVQFRVWADRRLIYDQVVPVNRNGLPCRLPSGFKSNVWQFEVRARAPIYSISVARSEKELRLA